MESKLKDIFQKKLNNYQAPVDASMWNTIQSGISGSTATVTSGGFMASVAAKIAAVIVAASVVGATIYFATQTSEPENAKVETTNTDVVNKSSQDLVEISPENTVDIKIEKVNTAVSEEKAIDKKAKDQSIPKIVAEVEDKKQPVTPVTPVVVNQNTDPIPAPINSAPKGITNDISNTNPTATPLSSFERLINEGIKVDFEINTIDEDDLSYRLVPSEELAEDLEVLWDFGNGVTSNEIRPTVYYSNEGDYKITLSVINDERAWELSSQDVEVYYPISWEVQNIFTPNDDMYNQYFDPSAKAENLTIETLVVYNNAQKPVFTSTQELKKWDGKESNGQMAPQGYYFYQVTAKGNNGQMHTKKGKVYLITGK